MRKRPRIKIGRDEEIIAIEHYYAGKFIRARIAHGEKDPKDPESFKMTDGQTIEDRVLSGEMYEKIMAADPKTKKPKGVYRRDDLWPYIDELRKTTAQINQ